MSTAKTGQAEMHPVSGSAAAKAPSGSDVNAAHQPALGETRLVALDGLRGLMTVMVLLSHYFAEVEHGWSAFCFGWIAVLTFFVLSGFLVGRLILDKIDRANFFSVFYIRRFCRTLPVYVFCVVIVSIFLEIYGNENWIDVSHPFPLWSYLTFTQNFFMISTDSIGPHWLAPTWTLTVEEHFYLIVPALFLFVPRRHLMTVLVAGVLLSIGFRAFVFGTGYFNDKAAMVLLPGNADALFCGLIAAALHKSGRLNHPRYILGLRIVPLLLVVATLSLKLIDGKTGHLFDIWGMFLMSAASAGYILAVTYDTPEAKRLHAKWLCFCGNNSYSIYLTHLAVVGLMHGLILGAKPDMATAAQIAVTFAAIPVAIFIGWVFTRLVEEPITAYGRSWKWSAEKRTPRSLFARANAAPVQA